jgi:hypothetical protein
MLGWVSEATVGEAIKPSRNCGRRLIPFHSAVDIPEDIVFIAIRLDLQIGILSPGNPAAPIFGCHPYALEITVGKFRRPMKWRLLTTHASSDRLETVTLADVVL